MGVVRPLRHRGKAIGGVAHAEKMITAGPFRSINDASAAVIDNDMYASLLDGDTVAR
jgi:hypothetical protein